MSTPIPKYLSICLLIVLSANSIAQNKRDTTWALSTGVKCSYDYYGFYASESYKLQNRPCSSAKINLEATKYFGKKKKFGLGLEPHFGISQIAFNAIIPNTDFDNLADSIDIYDNQISFYRDGIKLPEQTYTFHINYTVWGTALNLKWKLAKKLEVSIFLGFLQYIYLSKNYPNYKLEYLSPQLSGNKVRHTGFLNYSGNFWRKNGGINFNFYVTKRLKFTLLSQAMVAGRAGRFAFSKPYLRFPFTSSVSSASHFNYMNRSFSIGLGINYIFKN